MAMKPLRWLFSPLGFVLVAVLLISLYRASDAAGWRSYTCIISGTVPAGMTMGATLWRGGIYAVLYFGSILMAPILLLAAALQIVVFRRLC
jgi:hypothetical protein